MLWIIFYCMMYANSICQLCISSGTVTQLGKQILSLDSCAYTLGYEACISWMMLLLQLAIAIQLVMSSAMHVRVGILYRLGDLGHFLQAMHKNVAIQLYRLKPKIVKLSNTAVTTMTILLIALLEIISLIFVASIIIFPLHYPTRDMQED